MRLKSMSYSEYDGSPNTWTLTGLELGQINLIVGKNATGKTRTINVINGFARLLSAQDKLSYDSGNYESVFDHDNQAYSYSLKIQNAKIISEEFKRGDVLLLSRGAGGVGTIFSEKQNENLDFQTPDSELSAVARRDSIHHGFLELLHTWGMSLYCYSFGTTLGRDVFAVFIKDGKSKYDPHMDNQVVAAFREGIRRFGDAYKNLVISEINSVSYALEDIGVGVPRSISLLAEMPGELNCIWIKEKGVSTVVDQHHISQGMFRALSVIIQVSLSVLDKKASCILIDDIGEGLDFERSCLLIDYLIRTANGSSLQLIMTSNDRFVMNRVPLENWSVIRRSGNNCSVANYKNSKDKFDDFKFTGLNNFDFLATDFLAHSEN